MNINSFLIIRLFENLNNFNNKKLQILNFNKIIFLFNFF